MSLIQVEQYEVMYSADMFPPRICLKGPGGQNLGQLIFMPNGAALAQDNTSNGLVNLYYIWMI